MYVECIIYINKMCLDCWFFFSCNNIILIVSSFFCTCPSGCNLTLHSVYIIELFNSRANICGQKKPYINVLYTTEYYEHAMFIWSVPFPSPWNCFFFITTEHCDITYFYMKPLLRMQFFFINFPNFHSIRYNQVT